VTSYVKRLEPSPAGLAAWRRGCERFGPLVAELRARPDAPTERLRLDVQSIGRALAP
jgi:hypothetical protein